MKSSSVVLAVTLCAFAPAGDKESSFEGTVSATLTRAGVEPVHFVFTRKGNLLRIENTSNKLEPINIIDLETKKMTIVYPHNTTFVRVDLNTKPAQPGMPQLPPGFPSPPRMPNTSQPPPLNGSPARTSDAPGSDVATGKIGPNISPPPGFPTPPPLPSMPSMPQIPQNLGSAGASPAPIGAPPIGMMPGMPGPAGALELKKTDKTKKIQGFACTLYTTSERGENFEIWATNDAALFPFRFIERDFIGRRFGPQMLEETWPELLRNKSLFPLEATLKMKPGGQERLSFKVDKIESEPDGRKLESEPDWQKLFQPPEKYIEIQAPQ